MWFDAVQYTLLLLAVLNRILFFHGLLPAEFLSRRACSYFVQIVGLYIAREKTGDVTNGIN